jgi:hypothetical protein
MNAITSPHEGSDVLRLMSPAFRPPGGRRALGRSGPNESWSASKKFLRRANDHGDGTRCDYRSLAVRRGGCEPASSSTLIDAAAWFELQGDPRIQTIGPIGHACVAVSCTGSAAQCGRVDLGGERWDRTGRLEPAAGCVSQATRKAPEWRRLIARGGNPRKRSDPHISSGLDPRRERETLGCVASLSLHRTRNGTGRAGASGPGVDIMAVDRRPQGLNRPIPDCLSGDTGTIRAFLNHRAAARTIGPIAASAGSTPVLALLRRSRNRPSILGSLAP